MANYDLERNKKPKLGKKKNTKLSLDGKSQEHKTTRSQWQTHNTNNKHLN